MELIEDIVVGKAYGKVVTAFATGKSSIGMLFDITEIISPNLKKVFHLSPANQNKSAGLAYNDGDIGEIDPETTIFLTADKSLLGAQPGFNSTHYGGGYFVCFSNFVGVKAFSLLISDKH
jgi:hypothetical protein